MRVQLATGLSDLTQSSTAQTPRVIAFRDCSMRQSTTVSEEYCHMSWTSALSLARMEPQSHCQRLQRINITLKRPSPNTMDSSRAATLHYRPHTRGRLLQQSISARNRRVLHNEICYPQDMTIAVYRALVRYCSSPTTIRHCIRSCGQEGNWGRFSHCGNTSRVLQKEKVSDFMYIWLMQLFA